MEISLTSDYATAIKLHLEALSNYLASALAVSDRPDYYSSIVGDRFAIVDPNAIQLDPEKRSSPNCLFCILRSDLLLATVYDSEASANQSSAMEMINLTQAIASFKRTAQSRSYGFIYDVIADHRNGFRRSLRQNIDAPNVWVADITASVITKFILPLYPDGTIRPIPDPLT